MSEVRIGTVVSAGEILDAVEKGEAAERVGNYENASHHYGRALRLVRRRYQTAGNSPVSAQEMKSRQAATSQGLPSGATSCGGGV